MQDDLVMQLDDALIQFYILVNTLQKLKVLLENEKDEFVLYNYQLKANDLIKDIMDLTPNIKKLLKECLEYQKQNNLPISLNYVQLLREMENI